METVEKLDLNQVLEQVGKEKNIDKKVLVEALEAAMLTAARKKLGLTADLQATFDESLGMVRVFEFKKLVRDVRNASVEIAYDHAKKLDPELTEDLIGNDFGVEVNDKDFGRIAAQTAKQVIIQRVREAERNTIFGEYKDRKGELVTGIVRRFERGNVIVDLGRAEAVLPMREQVQRENIRSGERLVAYVMDVLEIARGPQIVLSRTHPNMVVKLFEQEVPEIAEGLVTIEAAAREAGVRSKIAVRSQDGDPDHAVGACIGTKGARVQAVQQELRGEKIDIVPWDEDEARFVCNALSPAEVTRVLVDEQNHTMQIVVPDDQLSLAIGRRGQNVRLAAQLTGWKIDITSETKVAEEREVAWASLSRIEGISEIVVQTLYNHGFRKALDVVEADEEYLAGLPGFSADAVPRVKASAAEVVRNEGAEREKVRAAARNHARVLLLTDAAGIAARAKQPDAERLAALNGVAPYVVARLTDADIMSPEDLFFEDDIDRLVAVAGFSAGKARQLKYAAAEYVTKLTNGAVPMVEKPLSEPEQRDAQQYDDLNANGPSDASNENVAANP